MTTPTNPLGDVKKMMEQFQLPGVDMQAFMESRRKDLDALIEANKAAYEAAQSLAGKQAEIITKAFQSFQALTTAVSDPAKQAELMRKAYEKTLVDMKDMADMVHKSQVDAVATLTKRATENTQEIKKLLQPPAAPKK
jgi:hypothetical protein